MKIFSWNPRTHRMYIPEDDVTIHGVKSFDSAKALIASENFDPNQYRYTVQCRNGKPFNFANMDDAIATARIKSTAKTAYTVFCNGKSIAGFMNKKQLVDWKTVYECVTPIDSSSIWNNNKLTMKEFRKTVNEGEYVSDMSVYKTSVDVAPGKVRYCITYIKFIHYKTGHYDVQFPKTSYIFNKDGSVYVHDRGKIEHVSACGISINGKEDIRKALKAELIKLRPELKQAINMAYSYDVLGVFSRPTAYYAFDTFHKTCTKRAERVYFGYYPKEIVDESKLINVLAKRMGIPATKTLKKLYHQNIHNMEIVHCLKQFGFKDVNSYKKLVAVGIHFMRHNPSRFAPFVKQLIALRGENNVARMMCDTIFGLIRDVAQSYTTIDEDMAKFVMKNARNFEEIHDAFNVYCHPRKHLVDRKIEYTDKEKKRYNYTCKDGVRFELAEGCKDLAIVGAEMGICVGGYAEPAIRRYTTIVKMMNGNKHIACIEILKSGIEQIKAKFNNPLQLENKKDLDEWIEHAQIKCDCHDYRMIGRPWGSTHNYAVIRPDDFEPEDHKPVLQIVKREHTSCINDNKWFDKEGLWQISYRTNRAQTIPGREDDEPEDDDELPF